jgi:DNA-binding transcriptional LysR family regulator
MIPAQVEAFVEVAHTGTLRVAAAHLHVSQPALTARIQGLESELGTTLFLRRHSGMELNHAGRAFLPYAERALESLHGGAALVAELAAGTTGKLAVGAAPAVGSYVLPELLERFHVDNPGIRLVVRTGHSEELLEMVLRHELDLALVRDLRDPRVRARPLFEDQLMLTLPSGHALAAQAGVDVAELRDQQLILFDRASSYYELTNASLRAAGVEPAGVLEVDSIETAKRLVQRGMGIALLPGTAVADSVAAGLVVTRRLTATPSIHRRIVAIEPLGGLDDGPAVAAFVALLDRIPELIPGARPIGRATPRQ